MCFIVLMMVALMINYETNYEPETTRIFDEVLKEGDKVIIAGAHQGYFVTYCSKLVGQSGKVYGFEPEKKNYAILKEKVKDLANVEVFQVALGDKEVTAKLFFNSDNDGGHSLWDCSDHPLNVLTKANPLVQPCEVKMIDKFFEDKDLTGLKLCMFDAEGSEHSILRGGINTITDYDVPYIICEISPALEACLSSQMSLRGFLSMYGYKAYMMEGKLVEPQKPVRVFATEDGNEVVFNMLFKRN